MITLTMKFYIDADGKYLGGWDSNPPDGAIEVPHAPMDARQIWNFQESSWSEQSPAVPERVTMRQAKEALILAGLDDDVEIALNAIQDPIQKKLALCQWRESNEMHRNMPLVQQIGAALGLSEQAIDDLFVEAAKR